MTDEQTSVGETFGSESVIERPVGAYAEGAYLEYAMSVVKGRALPAVTDGMKPVQRRILYAMNEMGLGSAAKPVKSARVVGDVLGKYHPHGDLACYEALVRVAQDFSLRYPLIDGQGNFGSRDGDGAAAMRYTECRLTPIAQLLLSEIGHGTVDFKPNYDGAFEEPEVLPARLPMLLLNGATGIAVGMATEIPSHNLSEVSRAAVRLINGEQFDVLDEISGPDYPGGGQIISSKEDIRAAYESGRGSLRARARWVFEDQARGQWRVIIQALAHGVSCAKLMSELDEITNPQPKAGKKTASQEQLQLKQAILAVLESARDESDKDNPVRLVLEPRSSKIDRDEFMRILLAHTSLEVSLPINLVSVGLDGAPRQKSLDQMLREWVEFRLLTVRRRLEFRLSQVLRRLHILEGRKIVFLNLDEVIKVIREAEDPKASLMERFGLSEDQANDVLEIRLRQLARLEWIKIEQEIAKLEQERDEINHLLANDAAFRAYVIAEVEADAKTFGDERRTLIETAQMVSASTTSSVVDEPVTLVMSAKGWVRIRPGHGVDGASLSFKEGDSLQSLVPCRTTDTAVFLTEGGKVFSLPCSALPSGRGDGVPLSSLVDTMGAKVVSVLVGSGAEKYLIVGSHGYGFTANLSDMFTRQKAGKAFVTVGSGEFVLPAQRLDGQEVLMLKSRERVLFVWIDEIRPLPKGGKGLQLMGLSGDDAVANIYVSSGGFELSGVAVSGKKTKEEVMLVDKAKFDEIVGRRGSRGKPLSFNLDKVHLLE